MENEVKANQPNQLNPTQPNPTQHAPLGNPPHLLRYPRRRKTLGCRAVRCRSGQRTEGAPQSGEPLTAAVLSMRLHTDYGKSHSTPADTRLLRAHCLSKMPRLADHPLVWYARMVHAIPTSRKKSNTCRLACTRLSLADRHSRSILSLFLHNLA